MIIKIYRNADPISNDCVIIAQVIAVPLVVLPPPSNTPSAHIRFGFAVPQRTDRPGIFGEPRMRAPCGRHRPSRFHQKAVEISNIFRQALGLPLIQAGGPPGHHDIRPNYPAIATFAPVIYNNKGVKVYDMRIEGGGVKVNDAPDVPHDTHPQPGYKYVHTHHRHPHNHHQLGKGPFIKRIHYSLMNLGRWEGRAVAFVLGKAISTTLLFPRLRIDRRLRNRCSPQDDLGPHRCHVPRCARTT